MTNTTPLEVATVIAQLGGARIFAMAFTYAAYERPPAGGVNVRFVIAKALVPNVRGKATHVEVTLMSDDTYTVVAHRVPTACEMLDGAQAAEVARFEMVYAGELRATVEGMTGLRLTLGTLTGAPKASAPW